MMADYAGGKLFTGVGGGSRVARALDPQSTPFCTVSLPHTVGAPTAPRLCPFSLPLPFSPVPAVGQEASLGLWGDNIVISLSLPFHFPFFCSQDAFQNASQAASQTTVYMSTNGLLTFSEEGSTDVDFRSGAAPNPATPGGVIAPFWGDLTTSGGVRNGLVAGVWRSWGPEGEPPVAVRLRWLNVSFPLVWSATLGFQVGGGRWEVGRRVGGAWGRGKEGSGKEGRGNAQVSRVGYPTGGEHYSCPAVTKMRLCRPSGVRKVRHVGAGWGRGEEREGGGGE